MYKVFLVEDEIVVREGIRNNIPWGKTAYTLAGEAADGEMALSIIKDVKPDILITDIRMPFMDGLTLSRIVKKTLPWIKIIILSGHDEFEYAREAISVGVEEYLLKPVSSQDMLETLDRIAARIDEEKEKLLSIEHLRQQAQSHSDILRDRWLCDFADGKVSAAEAIEKARELGLDLIARSYITAAISILPGQAAGTYAEAVSIRPLACGSPPDSRSQLLRAKLIIQSITEKYPNLILFQRDEKKHFMLIKTENTAELRSRVSPEKPGFSASPAGLPESAEDSVYSIAQAIKYDVERNTDCKIAVGIGSAAERLGELGKSFSRAEQIANRLASLGLPQIVDGETESAAAEDGAFDQAGLLNIDGDMLAAKFRYASVKDIDGIVQEFAGLLQDSPGENQILEYFILGEIIVAASRIIEELGGEIKKIIPFSLNQRELQKLVASRELFYEKIKALYTAVIEFRDSRSGGRYQSVILKAKEYIGKNFTDQDISLHTVASHVGISPNHFSTVFSQETGENFIEYLTRVRIEKAKQLLENTAIKSADIAYEAGFNDPHYFSFIFKKNTGLSPREYRNAKQAEKN
ncbi:DNA-binding response regulator [Spirochaetia bacterium]|nr:DNA-binding response regulator [Spirochaetia bacterium]